MRRILDKDRLVLTEEGIFITEDFYCENGIEFVIWSV